MNRCRAGDGGPAQPWRQRPFAQSSPGSQSAGVRHSGVKPEGVEQRYSAPVAAHSVNWLSNMRHSSTDMVGHGVRQTPERQTRPFAQSASTEQKGLPSHDGRQKSSPLQTAPVAQLAVLQSGRQRPK